MVEQTLFRQLTFIAALCVSALGCQSETAQTGDLVDHTGKSITLNGPAQRIVSLSPGFTELLFTIGAGDRVVGRTRWGDYPPAALEVPSVGDGLDPNVEAIAALRPDLVLFYASPSNDRAQTQLGALGITSASVRDDRLREFAAAARLIGRLSGTSTVADSLVQDFERQLDSLRATKPTEPVPSAVLLTWDNPPIVIGGASFLSEIIDLAGARNVFVDIDRPSATVTIETIAERNPDFVLLIAETGIPAWANRPEWKAVPAVRDGRFIVLSPGEFGRPSFRAPNAIRWLRSALADREH